MQMYPRDGGYKENYHAEEAEEFVYRDDCNYNRGSTMHMMKPHDQFKLNHGQNRGYGGGHNDQPKHNYDQYHGYGGGHNDQFKHNYDQYHGYGGGHNDQFKHNYDQYHGYGGGHNDQFKNGRESYSAQYAESWYEEETRADAWNVRNDYSGHGGKHQNDHGYAHNAAAMKHNGYGAHEGHYGPHKEHNKRVPVWEFKGIKD